MERWNWLPYSVCINEKTRNWFAWKTQTLSSLLLVWRSLAGSDLSLSWSRQAIKPDSILERVQQQHPFFPKTHYNEKKIGGYSAHSEWITDLFTKIDVDVLFIQWWLWKKRMNQVLGSPFIIAARGFSIVLHLLRLTEYGHSKTSIFSLTYFGKIIYNEANISDLVLRLDNGRMDRTERCYQKQQIWGNWWVLEMDLPVMKDRTIREILIVL